MDNLFSRITIDPAVCHGKPCVRGLRYPVEVLLELLSSGMTFEEVLNDYDDLEREDLLAVLAFAARLSQTKRMIKPTNDRATTSRWKFVVLDARRHLPIRLGPQRIAGVASKTIEWIEREETGKPQGDTLKKIGQALDVCTDEIEPY